MCLKSKNIIQNLQSQDKTFSLIVKQIGYINLEKKELNFEELIKIIINQQLSNHVSSIIFQRLRDKINKSELISPLSIIDFDNKKLRDLGISHSKISFMKETAKYFMDYPYIIKEWEKMNDEDAKIKIQELKGFGHWSAIIILLFYMGRNNVFPYNDSTLQKAYFKIYGERLSSNLSQINWARPYRSIVARYLWKWVDNGAKKI